MLSVCACRCGKLFKSELDAQAHAARTQHANFSESVDEIKPLTEEEKKAQLARYMYMYNVWVTLPPSLPLFPPPFSLSVIQPSIHAHAMHVHVLYLYTIYFILISYFHFLFCQAPILIIIISIGWKKRLSISEQREKNGKSLMLRRGRRLEGKRAKRFHKSSMTWR